MSKQTEMYIEEMKNMYNTIKKKQSEQVLLTVDETMFLKIYEKTMRDFL